MCTFRRTHHRRQPPLHYIFSQRQMDENGSRLHGSWEGFLFGSFGG